MKQILRDPYKIIMSHLFCVDDPIELGTYYI
jgi:hypothetical protein